MERRAQESHKRRRWQPFSGGWECNRSNLHGQSRCREGRWAEAEARRPAGLFKNDCHREHPLVSTPPLALA